MFAVVRHPDIEALGTVPESALEYHRLRGWYRVSDWREEPSAFHLPEFAEVFTDLDAPPEPDNESEVDDESETEPTVEDEEQA